MIRWNCTQNIENAGFVGDKSIVDFKCKRRPVDDYLAIALLEAPWMIRATLAFAS